MKFQKGNQYGKANKGRKRPDLTLRNRINNPMKNPSTRKKMKNSYYHTHLKSENNPMYGKENKWGKHTISAKENISKNNCNNKLEVRYKKSKYSKERHHMYGKTQSKESNKKRRLTTLKNINRLGGIKFGKNETQILDEIELSIGLKILRQHPVIGYSLDGYVPELNLTIEIDERRHFDINGNLKEKDIIRQKEIERELNCNFLRIKDNLNNEKNN